MDVLAAFFLVVLITLHPYFLEGKINIFEVGLYLPGINAVLHGLVPFRDFFHLRGPFEVYMPAAMMSIFGAQLSVLSVYFYVGTLLTLFLSILIAKELYRTRYVFYLMLLVLIARTFPRVVFTYWGGMRYALGLLAVWCAVKFFKQDRKRWMFFSGVATSCALFTSVEMGVYSIAGVCAALIFSFMFKLQDRRLILKASCMYAAGVAVISLPYLIYLWSVHALAPYLDSVYTVVTRMEYVINQHTLSEFPRNFRETLAAMINPASKNFRHLTPGYCYIVLGLYFVHRIRRKMLSRTDVHLVCIAVYGLIMYNSAFRSIWAAQFEMALQPEKILFFFILEEAYFYFEDKRRVILGRVKSSFPVQRENFKEYLKLYGILLLFFSLALSSAGYSIDRYNKRFFGFKYVRDLILKGNAESIRPLSRVPRRALNIERGRGMVVPVEQAEELEAINDFIRTRTKKDDVVFMYPELGTYSFLFDRPFLGRYPMATFAWFKDQWHEQFLSEFLSNAPEYIILTKELPPDWYAVYFSLEANKAKYNDIMNIINKDYRVEKITPQSIIYQRKRVNEK